MTEIKRKANAGERIKIVNAGFTFGDYANGTEMVVEKRENDRTVIVKDYGVPNGVTIIADYEYVVLEPDAPITVLPDESLGGTLREYREVKRKAAVGDLVKVTDESCDQYTAGKVYVAQEEPLGYGDIRIDSYNGGTVHMDAGEYVVLEASDILVIDGAKFRMVDREAAVGERVIVTKTAPRYASFSVGEHGIVTGEHGWVDADVNVDFGDKTMFIGPSAVNSEYTVLEPLTSAELAPTPTPLSTLPLVDQYAENIAVLTRKIAQLESRVETLESAKKPTHGVDAISYVEAASGPVKKSAQQIRDEIVERAKADVLGLEASYGGRVCGEGVSFWPDACAKYGYSPVHLVDYVVNAQKRTVVALIRYKSGELCYRGIAKCAPGETFNAHIGRAIALYRALGLEIPAEYLTCPQPEEVRVSDVVHYVGWRIAIVADDHDDIDVATHTFLGTAVSCGGEIIDDSRTGVAEDGGVSAASSALKGAA